MLESENNKIALTVDIEDWYHTPAVTGSNFSYYPDVEAFMESWKDRYDYLTKPTQRILSLLRQFDLKATFFVVADVIQYYPGLVESIAEAGHEIGCHGLNHAANLHTQNKQPMFSVDEFEERTGRAREMLQEVTGQKVKGYRAPGAYFGNWMFDSLIKLGFKYDSSICPNSFFNKTDMMIHDIGTNPYCVVTQNGRNGFVEMPLSYLKIGPGKLPTAGGPFLRFFPAPYIVAGLKDSKKRGHAVFYFHAIDISSEKMPVLASKNVKRPFYFCTSGIKTEKKLRYILNTFSPNWITCEKILDIC